MNSASQKAIYRAAKRKSGVRADINLWPLIGLLLVSLVTFMTMPMPSPYHDHVFLQYYPGRTHAVLQPAATRDDAMRISVLPDGQIYFRNSRASGNELPALITAAILEGTEKKIFLSADPRARNSDVEVVLDQLRTAGITRVAILTDFFAMPAK